MTRGPFCVADTNLQHTLRIWRQGRDSVSLWFADVISVDLIGVPAILEVSERTWLDLP